MTGWLCPEFIDYWCWFCMLNQPFGPCQLPSTETIWGRLPQTACGCQSPKHFDQSSVVVCIVCFGLKVFYRNLRLCSSPQHSALFSCHLLSYITFHVTVLLLNSSPCLCFNHLHCFLFYLLFLCDIDNDVMMTGIPFSEFGKGGPPGGRWSL